MQLQAHKSFGSGSGRLLHPCKRPPCAGVFNICKAHVHLDCPPAPQTVSSLALRLGVAGQTVQLTVAFRARSRF